MRVALSSQDAIKINSLWKYISYNQKELRLRKVIQLV